MLSMLMLMMPLAATADDAIACSNCDAWNRDVAPFNIAGTTWFVGVDGLSSVLIAGDDGHVLIDGGLPQSAPLIVKHIESLGFRMADVKWVLASHAHFDHVGGIAALARLSGAKVAASASAAKALRDGTPPADDPQPHAAGNPAFPKVANVRALEDGEVLSVGSLAITAERTPGHTPGGTSYRWRTCEGGRCFDVVYADSLTPVSLEPFRYIDHPDVIAQFERSIEKVRGFPCDVLVTAHPSASRLFERRDAKTIVDGEACARYATAMKTWLDEKLAKERATP